MTHPPDDTARPAAVACAQDRGENLGWSEPGPYGLPVEWEEVPAALTAEVVDELTACGWTGTHATEHSIVVPLDGRAFGLTDAAGRGEHLYVLWGVTRPEWSWGTAHPNAPAGGTLAVLLAPPDDPQRIATQIIRVLRTGRTLP
ncbi:hypothetical protein [Streptomyces sp. NPDC058548]|uniref:hypothetical protein n=1 Tax=Streptomyces sp. NPDC058548 TaxID=3346545 RepID=UPI00366571C4